MTLRGYETYGSTSTQGLSYCARKSRQALLHTKRENSFLKRPVTTCCRQTRINLNDVYLINTFDHRPGRFVNILGLVKNGSGILSKMSSFLAFIPSYRLQKKSLIMSC